jgi:hypothetical protein
MRWSDDRDKEPQPDASSTLTKRLEKLKVRCSMLYALTGAGGVERAMLKFRTCVVGYQST